MIAPSCPRPSHTSPGFPSVRRSISPSRSTLKMDFGGQNVVQAEEDEADVSPGRVTVTDSRAQLTPSLAPP